MFSRHLAKRLAADQEKSEMQEVRQKIGKPLAKLLAYQLAVKRSLVEDNRIHAHNWQGLRQLMYFDKQCVTPQILFTLVN